MIFVFYILVAIQIVFSYRSFRSGIDYLKYFESELKKPSSDFTPFASVIAPCKGVDDGLADNLTALLAQDYPTYEVIFVVDDENDEATAIIEEVSPKRAKGAEENRTNLKSKLVVAAKATDSSQKVENLREGVPHCSPQSEIVVFFDSDARPSADWLRSLIAPLEDEKIGAATGYRWFISKNPSFASELRSVWNASIASSLGRNTKSNICWGGSTALRRAVFERLDTRERWRGVVSDDFVLKRALNEAGLAIYFVPKALTASVTDCTFAELLEFTTRQIRIARVYEPRLWMMIFVGSALFAVVVVWSAAIVANNRRDIVAAVVALLTLAILAALGVAKAWLRLQAVEMALPEHRLNIRRQRFTQLSMWPLASLLYLYNAIAALASRRIVWRGVEYCLVSPRKTKVVRDA